MTDAQFKELMQKLDNIEREMKKPNGPWQPLFNPPLPPPQRPYDGLPKHWQWPIQATD